MDAYPIRGNVVMVCLLGLPAIDSAIYLLLQLIKYRSLMSPPLGKS